MAIKGAQAKIDITKKILEIFPGAFTYEKEIRIPYTDVDNTTGEIKVTLTAAKTAVGGGTNPVEDTTAVSANSTDINEQVPQEPSSEEKERLAMLLEKLGI